MPYQVDSIVEKMLKTVEQHRLSSGAYSRYLWQDETNSRKMGVNEYGCADAANILYILGHFPTDPEERKNWVDTMQNMQDRDTGLFFEGTHHTLHTTAHVTAALELFDARPLYPLRDLERFLNKDTLYDFLEHLDWEHKPWPQSHQGAGLFAAMTITRMVSEEWQNWYFDWLRVSGDPIGLIPGINKMYIDADSRLSSDLADIARRQNNHVHIGTIATGDQFIASKEQSEKIRRTFPDTLAAEMEGGSIGHVCYINKVPFAVLRAISDGGNDDAFIDYPQFVHIAAGRAVDILMEYLKNA